MITNAQVSKQLKFQIGGGFETIQVGITLDFEIDEDSVPVKEQIADYTKVVDEYCKEELRKHKSIVSDKSIFFKGGK